MKPRIAFPALALALSYALPSLCPLPACGQGTAFTYQGQLKQSSVPVNGNYDLRFSLFGVSSGGSPTAGPLTASSIPVSNGLFTATLDFGAGAFNGSPRWLEVEVSVAGAGLFTTLSPRQQITSAPYAIQALGANSVPPGTITSAMLAPGSAEANLLASGMSSVVPGGVVLSEQEYAPNLLSQGYVRLAKVDLVAEAWRTLTNGPPLRLTGVLSRKDFAAVWTGSEMYVWGGQDGSGALNTGGRYNPSTDAWIPMTTSNAPTPQVNPSAAWTGTYLVVWGNSGPTRGGRYDPATDTWLPLSEANAPSARTLHSAVWTGAQLVIWGGFDGTNYLNTGARYDPVANLWSATQPSGAPAIRAQHSAIWTGTEMIIWGGKQIQSCGFLCIATTDYNDGARYNPVSDTWQPVTTSGAPLGRCAHSAVWSGAEMIIWGGNNAQGSSLGIATNMNSGARYNPNLNQWSSAMPTTGAPSAREGQSAHWIGTRMLIWGGTTSVQNTNFSDGAAFEPASLTWFPVNGTGAPPARVGYRTVWTGTEMLLWGGEDASQPGTYSEIGRRYNPGTDSWSTLSPGGDPSARANPAAVWAQTEMLAWGGAGREYALRTGGRLNPSKPTPQMWSNVALSGSPGARTNHTAVWTGSDVLVWGGMNGAQALNSGGRYTPVSNTWTTLSTAGAPAGRARHVAVWTGNRMVVWGGFDGTNYLATGGRYNPSANSWQTVSTVNAPAPRADATAVWTGTELLVWGGLSVAAGSNTFFSIGGRYDPVADTWQTLPTSGAPEGRASHTAVWTGSEMIVWGGETRFGRTNSGARFSPVANQWLALPMNGSPSARAEHSAVWAGTQMIVWGGFDGTNEVSSGARYDPIKDLWSATTSTNAPATRQRHAAVWSGTEMLIWAGKRFNGVNDVFLDDASAYAPPRTMYLYLRP